ncbi:MATE efflux family protein [Ascodesmis nigricans]|uniref:MATE efflux family protein n=1 Tax=Ascodesmis nigricans TaxID=341454 RepID=A0A4S2MW41_9PEZI|nr:MATE efflux family protein [Ascodesmis nigricans]
MSSPRPTPPNLTIPNRSSSPRGILRISNNNSPRHSTTSHLNHSAVEDSDDEEHAQRTSSLSSSLNLVGGFRRPSFSYGAATARPAYIPSSSPIPTDIDTLPTPEKKKMEREQLALLKDNDLFPVETTPGRQRGRNLSISSSKISSFLDLHRGEADETTALLGHTPVDYQWEVAVEAGKIETSYRREIKTILQYSLPLYVTFLLQYSLTMSSIFAAGNLGKDQLAGISVACMSAIITGYAPYQGLSTALDTLCAQAYGSGNKHLVGLHLQRMVYFLLLFTIPVVVIWQYSEEILLATLPEPELARWAGLYLRILSWGAPGYAIFEASKRFCQAQGLFSAATYVLIICAPLNAFLNWTLVWHERFGLGYIGAPIAVVITNWTMPTLLLLYITFVRGKECWGGFSRRAFSNWLPMIKLAIPGFIMLEAEYAAFEVLTLVASEFGTAHVAAQSVLSYTSSMMFQLAFAVSIATSTRVANFLGATLGDAAKLSAQTGILISCVVGIWNAFFMWAIRKFYVGLFTDDAEVIALFLKTVWVGCAFQFFDAVGVVTAGVLRGQGRQRIGSYINLIAYYVLGLPISMVAGFVFGLELIGLWTGVAVALMFIAAVECVILHNTDWDEIVSDAKERVAVDME